MVVRGRREWMRKGSSQEEGGELGGGRGARGRWGVSEKERGYGKGG